MIATIRSEVPTGRSMKIRDGFMSRTRLLVRLRRPSGAAAANRARIRAFAVGGRRSSNRPRGHADLGPLAQAVGAVHHHAIVEGQPLGHGDLRAGAYARLDDRDFDRIVGLDAIDKGAGL